MPVIIRALLQARQDLAYVPQPLVALQLAVLTICKTSQPALSTNPSQPPPDKGESEGVSSAQLQSLWPELIQAVKPLNPVASTFLRATQPSAVEDSVVTIRMQYGLHRNFFEKPDNKKLVEEQLSKLLKTEVTIRCQVDEVVIVPAAARQEDDLFQAVQEVFGKK